MKYTMFDIFDRIECVFKGHVWEFVVPPKKDGIDIAEHYFNILKQYFVEGGSIKLKCVNCGKVKCIRLNP